jgi:hypothetical protein
MFDAGWRISKKVEGKRKREWEFGCRMPDIGCQMLACPFFE